jgi:hypothetical protein
MTFAPESSLGFWQRGAQNRGKRNAAVPRRFKRLSHFTRWRPTGWLGRRDSNLCIRNLRPAGFTLHLRIGIRQDSQLGAGEVEHAHLD